jgi:S-layer protein (TIGR01567 family)
MNGSLIEEKPEAAIVIDSDSTDNDITIGIISGQKFNESAGILMKKWDASNFPGFWREEDVSTEKLIIDQSLLNNSYRVIDKHNLIYTTKPITLNYEVYENANRTPTGTNGYYSALGWQGEKYVLLPDKKIARIILEQNEFDERLMRPLETWNLGEGYSIFVNSVEIKSGVQTWFTLFRDGNKISDVILGPYIEKLYTYQTELNSTPVVIVYFSGFKLDGAAFKYGWLRSQNITDIKKGDIFGVMEVTSIDNGSIELRNKEPIALTPGSIVNLMGNISIQVDSSKNYLSFHPFKVRQP